GAAVGGHAAGAGRAGAGRAGDAARIDGARVDAPMSVMKLKAAVQFGVVGAADRVAHAIAPGRCDEPAQHDARDRSHPTDSFDLHRPPSPRAPELQRARPINCTSEANAASAGTRRPIAYEITGA